MRPIHIERLIKLANYIDEISDEIWYDTPQNIVFYSEDTHTGFETKYFRWVFDDMPYLFQHWYYRDESAFYHRESEQWIFMTDLTVHDLANRDQGTVWSAMFFFKLDEEEFLHIFGYGPNMQQPQKFGGVIYQTAEMITGKHIATNIREFLTNNNNQNE